MLILFINVVIFHFLEILYDHNSVTSKIKKKKPKNNSNIYNIIRRSDGIKNTIYLYYLLQ